MANWYFYDNYGRKQGPMTGAQLKGLASDGLVTPETIVENDAGKRGRAKLVQGLVFAETTQLAKSSPAVPRTLNNHHHAADNQTPLQKVSEPVANKNKIVLLASVIGGFLFLLIVGGGIGFAIMSTTSTTTENAENQFPAASRPTEQAESPVPVTSRPTEHAETAVPAVSKPTELAENRVPTASRPTEQAEKPEPAASRPTELAENRVPAVSASAPPATQQVTAPPIPASPRQDANQIRFTAAEQAEIDNFLAKYGNDAKAVKGGETLLHAAVAECGVAVTKYLVSQGADANAKNRNDVTPLHVAARSNKDVDVARFLVSANADVKAKDNIGNTPLHAAARYNKNVDVARFLVSSGADVTAKTNSGRTPLDWATKEGNMVVAKFLAAVTAPSTPARQPTPSKPATQPDVPPVRAMGADLNLYGRTLDNQEFDWNALRGKYVLVKFTATWCGPCKGEIPGMLNAYQQYKHKGLEIVSVYVWERGSDPAATVRSFVQEEGLPWTILVEDLTEKAGKPKQGEFYAVRGVPTMLLIDREGKVISTSARGEELQRLLLHHLGT